MPGLRGCMMETFEENADASWTHQDSSAQKRQVERAVIRTNAPSVSAWAACCVRYALVDVLALDNALAILGELHVALCGRSVSALRRHAAREDEMETTARTSWPADLPTYFV